MVYPNDLKGVTMIRYLDNTNNDHQNLNININPNTYISNFRALTKRDNFDMMFVFYESENYYYS